LIDDRIKGEGHLIGDHTYSHIQFTSNNRDGEKVEYARLRYGSWDKSFEKALEAILFD